MSLIFKRLGILRFIAVDESFLQFLPSVLEVEVFAATLKI